MRVRAAALCAVLVGLQALIVLTGFHQGDAPILGGDGPEYNIYALNLARHGAFSLATSAPFAPGITRTPGYPAFLAVFDLIGLSPLAVRIVQFALFLAIVWLVLRLGTRVAGGRVGAVAAVLCALYTPLAWFASEHMTEVITTLGVTALILAVLEASERPAPAWLPWAAVALILALLTYVRPEYAGLIVVMALAAGAGVGVGRRADLRAPLLVLAVFVAAIAPWTIRNAVQSHRFVPLDAGSGVSLFASVEQYRGDFPLTGTTARDWSRFYAQVFTPAFFARYHSYDIQAQIALDSELTHRARSLARRTSLGSYLGRLPRRLLALWAPADPTPPGHRLSTLAHRFAQIYWGLLALLILAGIGLRGRRWRRDWPLWIIAAYLTLVHVVFHVEPRYTLPARPVLFVYAALSLVALVQRASRRARPDGINAAVA